MLIERRRKFTDVRGDHVVFDDITGAFEPEFGDHIQHAALLRNAVGHDTVEGGNAVAGDKQQPVTSVKNFTYFAAARRYTGNFNLG